jgi:FMN phosphatase YigB (HAD superfamily)
MDKFNLNPSETMMVGNDVYEDMIASELGIKTYLITNCLKNTQNLEYNHFEQGSLEEFYKNIVMTD